jgi:fucose 4-O-acetylase-like acetyltransferase
MTDSLEPPVPKSRSATVDIAKGIGIMLVVLGHNWFSIAGPHASELHRVIFSFHLPLFFFLSGVFLNPEKRLGRVAADKCRSLLTPYIIVCCLFICAKAVLKRHFPWDWVVGSLSILYAPPEVGASWFLPQLFLVALFSWVFVKLSRTGCPHTSRRTTALLMLLIAGYGAITLGARVTIRLDTTIMTKGLPLGIDIIIISGFFYVAGYFFRNKVLHFKFSAPAVTAAVVLFTVVQIKGHCSMDIVKRLYDHILWSSLAAALGIYLVLAVSYLLSLQRFSRQWISYVGRGSMVIMIFHGLFQGQGYHYFGMVFPGSPYTVAVASFCCGVVIPLVIKEGIALVKKRLPAVAAVRQP